MQPLKVMVDAALKEISVHFDAIFSHIGWASPPVGEVAQIFLAASSLPFSSDWQLVKKTVVLRWLFYMTLDETKRP